MKMIATTPRNKNDTRQDYETPQDFFGAVSKNLKFEWDLAADKHNAKCTNFITEEQDTFKYCWHTLSDNFLWLNPPFKNIEPWVKKCKEESIKSAKIAMLVPASVGSNWFKNYVFNQAMVIFLNGRLIFEGETKPYPKDCMLVVWWNFMKPGIGIWRWKEEVNF